MGEGFKADSEKLGPKLGEVRASGPTGLQRRVEAARALERARVEAERVHGTPEDVVKAGARVIEAAIDKVEAAQGMQRGGSGPAPASTAPEVEPLAVGGRRRHAGPGESPGAKRPRGRPMKEGPVSRATAFRRRKREAMKPA